MLVFNDENRLELYDFEHSYCEDRYNTISLVYDVLFVVYTERKDKLRIISARLASLKEGVFIMIKTATLSKGQKPTEEQIRQIEDAKKKPIVYDEDSPELSPAMEKVFLLAAKTRNRYQNIS